jgi:hypothetical protein
MDEYLTLRQLEGGSRPSRPNYRRLYDAVSANAQLGDFKIIRYPGVPDESIGIPLDLKSGLPQQMREVIPYTGNRFVDFLKIGFETDYDTAAQSLGSHMTPVFQVGINRSFDLRHFSHDNLLRFAENLREALPYYLAERLTTDTRYTSGIDIFVGIGENDEAIVINFRGFGEDFDVQVELVDEYGEAPDAIAEKITTDDNTPLIGIGFPRTKVTTFEDFQDKVGACIDFSEIFIKTLETTEWD